MDTDRIASGRVRSVMVEGGSSRWKRGRHGGKKKMAMPCWTVIVDADVLISQTEEVIKELEEMPKSRGKNRSLARLTFRRLLERLKEKVAN